MSGPQGLRIERMYAFIAVDPEDNNEGVIGCLVPDQGYLPLVGADMERVEQLRPLAQQIARSSGMEVKLAVFSAREDVEVLH